MHDSGGKKAAAVFMFLPKPLTVGDVQSAATVTGTTRTHVLASSESVPEFSVFSVFYKCSSCKKYFLSDLFLEERSCTLLCVVTI